MQCKECSRAMKESYIANMATLDNGVAIGLVGCDKHVQKFLAEIRAYRGMKRIFSEAKQGLAELEGRITE